MYRVHPLRHLARISAIVPHVFRQCSLRWLTLLLCSAAVAGAQASQNFPNLIPVGQTATQTVTVTVTIAGTAATPIALTSGVPNLDFSILAGGTCQSGASYTVNQTCTANVQFGPRYPGQRIGAVVLPDANGAALGTAYIGGTASGALPVLIPGRIDTVAGSGPWIYSSDGVAATTATLFTPQGIVVDPAGNLLLSDTGNNRIRRVDALTGLISTIAGNGTQGFSGDGGPATSASIASPAGLVFDGAGNLYFADTVNHVVRRVDAITKVITTVAGTPQVAGFQRTTALATSSGLNLPLGVAIDSAGHLLIADTGNHAIRSVNLVTNSMTTVAGTGNAGYNGDNQLATSALFNSPSALFPLSDGSLLISDSANNRVRHVDPLGIVTTIAGTGAKGFSGDGAAATAATLNSPVGLAMDPGGQIYIADSANNRIRAISAQTGIISTITGTDSEGFFGDGGPANVANQYGPFAVVFTQGGDIYLSDMFHMRIRKISGSSLRVLYPTIRRGKVSAVQVQQLGNAGDVPLQLATPALVYAQLDPSTTTCSSTASLAPSNTCMLGVEFYPDVPEAGFVSGSDIVGSVTLPSNATNVTPVITVDGIVLDVNPTSVALTSSANPSVLASQVLFTATVTSDDTGRTGTVTFTADGNTLCSGALAANGTAACTTSALTLGSHSIVAQYGGDAQNAAATSPTLTQIVKQQASFALTSSVNPVVVTNPVTLTVVASAPTGTPSGTVVFLDGTTSLGSVMLSSGRAAITINTLAVGAHAITVQYAGDTQNAPSTSDPFTQTVQQATTTTMLATSGATVPVGTAVLLTATVTSGGGPAPGGIVTFAEGATTYGSAPLQTNGTASVNVSNLSPGVHALVATYAGDSNNSGSASAAITETVQQIGTTTTLTTDSNPLAAGATLHITAQVALAAGATADGALNGQVVFRDGTTTLATVALNAALSATLEMHGVTVGSHSFTATYLGSTNYATSTGSLTETVTQTATTTTLTSAATPTLAGRPAIFTMVVTSTTATPTGSVTLLDGTTTIGSASLNGSGSATLSLTTLAVGAHTLTAVYSGDSNYVVSTSAPITQTVNKATPSVSLTGPSAPVNITTNAAFAGTVTSPGLAPTGTITLQEGNTVIATQAVNSTFTFSSSNFSAGQHTLVVAYGGDANNAAAQSAPFVLTVQLAPTATTLATSGSPSIVGKAVTFTAATTTPTANLTGSVTFFDGATALASVPLANGTAVFTTTALAFGPHTLTATYTADANHAASTSAALSQTMVQQTSVNLSSALNPSNSGQAVTFTAALPAVGGVTPTGSVVFSSDGTPLATVPLDAGGNAHVQTSALAVGTHVLTLTYAGDSSFSAGSATLSQVVRNASTTTSLTVSADPVTYGTAVTFTATVTSNGGAATGTVSFTENGTVLGSGKLGDTGVATLSLSSLAPGRHTVVANYLGDGKASTSTSTAASFLVRQQTRLALGSSANPSLSLDGITITAGLANGGAAPASGSIVFLEGATTLGTAALDANGNAAIALPSLSVGAHTLTATYAGDDADFAATAAPLSQIVQKRTTTTALTSSSTNADDAQQITLIAVVQSSTLATGTMPTGNVTFTTGTTTVGVVPVDASGVATLTIRLAASSSETLIATYSGDGNYTTSASGKAQVTSGPASQFVLSVSSPSIQMQSGQRTVINLTVASVKGFNDMLKFGCVGLPYAATCTFSSVDVQLAANGSGNLQLTVDTGDPLGAGTSAKANNDLPRLFGNGVTLCLLPAAALLCFFRKRRCTSLLTALLLSVALSAGLAGCAGLTTNSTPAGTYTFQVTANGQGTGATESQTITLTVAK